MSDKEHKSPINIDVGAKAEAKFEVKAEVPSSSAGRFLDAVTDMFRPFSERRGLRADQIRLQREDVLIEVAKRAHKRMEIEQRPITPISNKMLIPLMEKASLETPGDDIMIERWANLLVSAAGNPSAHPRFVQILSEMTGKQAELLEFFLFKDRHSDEKISTDGLRFDLEEPELTKIFEERLRNDWSGPRLHEHIPELLSGRGFMLEMFMETLRGYEPARFDKTYYINEESIVDLQILRSLYLLEYRSFRYIAENSVFNLSFYQVTNVGLKLLQLCSPRAEKLLERLGNKRAVRER